MAGAWALRGFQQELGPSLGRVTERLSELDLSEAFPRHDPQHDLLLDRDIYASTPSPELRRANLWAAALEEHLAHDRERLTPVGTVITTFGFVHFGGQVRLSVIHYVAPPLVFAVSAPARIEIAGRSFPSVVRPWLPLAHSAPEAPHVYGVHVALPPFRGHGLCGFLRVRDLE